jgi:S-formylglutathione hydrolase FrmB
MERGKLIIVVFLLICFHFSEAAEFTKKQFFSSSLNREATYFVSLPDGYSETDTTKKFPVMVFLHGATATAQDVVDQFEVVLANPFTRALFQKVFNVILVIPDGSCSPFLGSFYTNSALYGNYEDYISLDLTNEISSNYNTYNHREKWSIIGHSMGGYGVMKLAMKNPDLFIGVAALSGPLHTTYYNDILPIVLAENGGVAPYNFTYSGNVTKLIYSMAGAFSPNTANDPPVNFPILADGTINQEIMPLWEEHNPINLIKNWNGDPKMAIYMYCGELDEYKIMSQNQLFSDSLKNRNIIHEFTIDPSGDHVMSLLTSFPQGLNFLVNVMDTATIPNHAAADMHEIASSKIFPNPTKDNLFLSSDFNLKTETATIISLTGSVVKTVQVKGNKVISVADLAKGCYLLKVNYTNGQYSKFRFVKTE